MPRPRPHRLPLGSRYEQLADFLAAQASDAARLNFAQIEAVLRQPLPRSAHLRQWWRNGRAMRAPLATIGWQVVGVDIRAGTVTFARVPDVDA